MQNFGDFFNFLFGFKGRMAQGAYFVLGIILPPCAVYGLEYFEDSIEASPTAIDNVAYVVLLVTAIWIMVAATVKRFHDFGWHGGWSLLILFGPGVLLVGLFKTGDEGDNEYGPGPGPRYADDSEADWPKDPRSNF